VARNGHPASFFLHSTCERQPALYVRTSKFDVRTWNSTFLCGVSRGNVEFHVRTWNSTCARRHGWRANVKLHVPTWSFTCERRTLTFSRQPGPRANVEFDVHTWSVKKTRGMTVTVHYLVRYDNSDNSKFI